MQVGSVSVGPGAWLAPMAGVTDRVFREICRKKGAAVTFTEMVSANGLWYNAARASALYELSAGDHPSALQLFGGEPQVLAQMAREFAGSFDWVDINMGCPVPKVVKNGYGSALMQDTAKAALIVRAVAQAIDMPVTVKIRAGWDDSSRNAADFAMAMEESGAAAITVHGRTRMQFYSGKADWDIIGEVKRRVGIPVIGNGDVTSGQEAARMLHHTGCDAVMVGRAAQGNPWVFQQIIHYLQHGEELSQPSPRERVETALYHARELTHTRDERQAVLALRKHMAWYLAGVRGAAGIRRRINEAESYQQLERTMAEALE